MDPTSSTTSNELNIGRLPEPDGQLDDILDARLLAEPRIHDFHRSVREDSILLSSDAPPGAIVRVARLADRALSVVAVPNGPSDLPTLRRSLRDHWKRKNVVVVSERWLRRRPHLDCSNLIADSARYPVSPLAYVRIAEHLTDHGGSSYLSDCAGHLPRSQDPVRAVLSLAATKAIAIDISRPIGPWTRVSLPPPR